MHPILRAVVFFFAVFSAANAGADCDCTTADDLGHRERPVVVRPDQPPADAYEVFSHITRELIEDEDLGQVEACVIHLKPVEWPQDGNIPVDDYGNLMVMLDDGLTFIPVDELIDSVHAPSCTILDPEAGIIAGLSLF